MTKVVLVTGGLGLGAAIHHILQDAGVKVVAPDANMAEELPDPTPIPALPAPPIPVARQFGSDGHPRRYRKKGRNRRRW